MSDRKSDLFQVGLLVLIVILLATNAVLFLRLNRFQSEVLTALRGLQAGEGDALVGIGAGSAAPDFSLRTLDGQEIRLEDYRDRSLLLLFSAIDCPICDRSYPTFQLFKETHPEQEILLVSRGTPDENRAIVEREGFSFPVVFWEGAVAEAYKIPGTPFGVAVDGNGTVMDSGTVGTIEEIVRLLKIPG